MTDTTSEEISRINENISYVWTRRGVSEEGFDSRIKGALEKSEALGYKFGIGRCLVLLGMRAFITEHNGELASKHINSSIEIFSELNDAKWIANAQLTLGIIQNTIGNKEIALYNSLKGIDYYLHHSDDTNDRVMAFYVAGTVHKDINNIDEAIRFYENGLSGENFESDTWSGRIQASLSGIYMDRGQYDLALDHGLKALQILKDQKNDLGISRALTDIGNIYRRLKNYKSALEYFFEGLEVRERANVRQFTAGSQFEIGSLYREIGEYEKAISSLKKAEQICDEINFQPRLILIYAEITEVYKLIGDYRSALEYSEKNLSLSTKMNKKEAEKKFDSLKNSLLKEKEDEIERLKNVELKEAYHLISEKQKEILDSISYAQRIQKAIMTQEQYIEKNLQRMRKK